MIIIFHFSRPFEAGFDHQERRPVESLEEGHCAYGHVCQLILGRSRFKDAETGCRSLLLFDLCVTGVGKCPILGILDIT